MESFEILWNILESFGILWIPLGSFGFLWDPLGSFGIFTYALRLLFSLPNSAACKESILATGQVPDTWNFEDSWICSQDSGIKDVACQGSGGNALVCEENETKR